MNPNSEIDPRLMKKLDLLQAVPARDPEKERMGRAAFLQQAESLQTTVTAPEKRRLNGWMVALQSLFVVRRKDQSPMLSTLATILLVVSLVFGGGGAAVAAAQNSLPDQLLYGLKVISEDVRLGVTSDPAEQFQLALEFANRRSEEIQHMLKTGSTPPETVQNRYQNQVEQAMQFATALPTDRAVLALEQIRTRLQVQEQTLMQVEMNGSPNAQAVRLQTRQMLQEHLQWVAEGLMNPEKLRETIRLRQMQRNQERINTPAPGETITRESPGSGGGNPWTTGTPTPGSGYGNGMTPGNCLNCTPSGGGQGGNPWMTGTPMPGGGTGSGPGPMSTGTCTAGSNCGPGPQATQQPNYQTPQSTPQQTGQPPQMTPMHTQMPQSTSSGPGPHSTTMPGGGGRP
jgi:hypothetical protein